MSEGSWISGVIAGAVVAIVSSMLTLLTATLLSWKKARAEKSKEEQVFRSVLTAMYSARNYCLEQISFIEDNSLYHIRSTAQSLRAIDQVLEFAIKASPKNSEHFLFCFAEWKLHLENYCLFLEDYDLLGDHILEYAARRDALLNALEQFDLIAHFNLDFISAEELNAMSDLGMQT